METFLSLCYTSVDTICLILFLDVFARRRLDNLKFQFNAFCYVLFECWIPLALSTIIGRNQIFKIFIVLLVDFIIAEKLYTGISTIALGFLLVLNICCHTAYLSLSE